jgi:hypothetical protein
VPLVRPVRPVRTTPPVRLVPLVPPVRLVPLVPPVPLERPVPLVRPGAASGWASRRRTGASASSVAGISPSR